MRPTFKSTILTLAVTAALAIAPIAEAAVEYEVVNIGNLPGATGGRPTAINNHNRVVGYSTAGGNRFGFSYTEQGGIFKLQNWGYDDFTPTAINDHGRIVGTYKDGTAQKGFYQVNDSPGNAFMWFLHAPTPFDDASPNAINNLNQVVGAAKPLGALFPASNRAAGWTIQFGEFLIPAYGPEEGSAIHDINDNSDMAGEAFLAGTQRATIYRNSGTLQDLHFLLPGATNSIATALNNADWTVGLFRRPDFSVWAFAWNPELGVTVLDSYPQAQGSSLADISGDGTAVGAVTDRFGQNQAIRWNLEAGLVDLNTRIDPNTGWHLQRAVGVNDNGYIVGYGTYLGVESNFLLKPVPEPATLALLALLPLARKRRRTQST